MRDAFSQLDQLERDLTALDTAALEAKYAARTAAALGTAVADEIAALELGDYRAALEQGLVSAVTRAQRARAIVVHFEYDLRGEWESWFFVCHDYATADEDDDSWVKDYAEELRGPVLERLAALHRAHGAFDDSRRFAATLQLVARLAVLLRDLARAAPHPRIGVCMGYSKQDPLWRLREPRM